MHDLRRYWDANGRRRGGAERGESGQWRGEWAGSGRTEHAYVSRFPTAHTVGLLRAYAVGHGFNDFGSTAATTSTNDGRRRVGSLVCPISATVQTDSYRAQMRENERKQIWSSQADEHRDKLPTTRPSSPLPQTTLLGCCFQRCQSSWSPFGAHCYQCLQNVWCAGISK